MNIFSAKFDEEDYPDLNFFFIMLIQMYRNSIGDISAPSYGRWSDLLESNSKYEQNKAYMMITLIWIVWVLHQFMNLIILLNFLIAIISQSYENVMQKLVVFKYKTRVDFNLECL